MNSEIEVERKVDATLLAERAAKLDQTAVALKKHFIGIDRTIDELISAIRVWHLMPEVLTRPVIINLWGMTGVGKTDLIRRLVSGLGMQERFLEIELSHESEDDSVARLMSRNSMEDTRPKILLFDEIQRFNTLDNKREPLTKTKFSDFWELLSDGQLSRRFRDSIESRIAYWEIRAMENKRNLAKGEEIEEVDRWDADTLAPIFETDTTIIVTMSPEEIVARLQAVRKMKKIFEPIDHSKTLILISGNLDDAFDMASNVSETDITADIFAAFANKVTIVDVKESLAGRFKPEQVARFGNIHLIYGSLRRIDFEQLIQREIARIRSNIFELFEIEVTVSEDIEALIYRNGVFPVQGVRPVFSTIGDLLESNLALFVLEEMLAGSKSVAVKYDAENEEMVATLSEGRVMRTKCVGRIDKVREQVEHLIANVAVHECGHAVAYGKLFGLAPLQLVSKVASNTNGGFTFPHEIHGTKTNLLRRIQILLAGGIAEGMIFGEKQISLGRRHDLEQATKLAAEFVRVYAFSDAFRANYVLDDNGELDKVVTDKHVEELLVKLEQETETLLKNHEDWLIQLSKLLQKAGSLTGVEVARSAKNFGLDLEVKPEAYLHITDYSDRLASHKKPS